MHDFLENGIINRTLKLILRNLLTNADVSKLNENIQKTKFLNGKISQISHNKIKIKETASQV